MIAVSAASRDFYHSHR